MTTPTPPTIDTIATELNTLKDHIYTLTDTEPNSATQQYLKQAWDRLDSALWSLRQTTPTLPNPHPDLRATMRHPHSSNPIDTEPTTT